MQFSECPTESFLHRSRETVQVDATMGRKNSSDCDFVYPETEYLEQWVLREGSEVPMKVILPESEAPLVLLLLLLYLSTFFAVT